jgi:hypothetical protein
MTMLVLINYKDGVILAADKRAVWKSGSEVSHVISDEVDKIYTWNGGYIAGSGYAPLLENVKDFAAKNTINSADEIADYLRLVIQNSSIHQQWINTSNFALIYGTSSGFRAVTLSAKNYEMRALEEDGVSIMIGKIDTSLFEEQLKSEIKNPNPNIHNVIDILKKLFKHVSSLDITVSCDFDFSIINSNGMAMGKIDC